ncbi:uncharacterized protein LAESUDRAFT_133808 [Laetiporus sulphureus 93-53]|uniref:Uncharacterized protein n=1 Tax=Laetiporus sulphureus 93-53 TaxID=1314785 RepID=A0A165EIC4_9APHY|nr:uncharacterized protein LAESUDRAFT_133808 [Laetiporus sulphureus 93-53]KZT07113.1 hypothetical protein LAESUDRAFT_133808 [Laetiporus sulphureus 93-53]
MFRVHHGSYLWHESCNQSTVHSSTANTHSPGLIQIAKLGRESPKPAYAELKCHAHARNKRKLMNTPITPNFTHAASARRSTILTYPPERACHIDAASSFPATYIAYHHDRVSAATHIHRAAVQDVARQRGQAGAYRRPWRAAVGALAWRAPISAAARAQVEAACHTQTALCHEREDVCGRKEEREGKRRRPRCT